MIAEEEEEWSRVERKGKEGRRQKGQMVNDKNASTSEDSGQEDIHSLYSSSDLDTGTPPPPPRFSHPAIMENRTLDASARSSGHLFEFDPGQMTSIIRRKAMLKELASCYQAECAYYCQELLELQGKWEQELDASSIGADGVELLQGHETSNPKYALENEMCLEGAHMPLQKIKQASSTVSTSNEDVGSADVMENSTGASKAPLRRRLSWRANEREALRRGLLMFGLGRSDRVRSVMHSILKQMRHGLGDIADCCWEFVRICGLHADEKERPYAEKLYEKSKDLGIEVGPEVSSRVGPWDRVEKSASGWLKRLVLLDSLGNVIRLCASKETQEAAYNAIDNLKDGTIPFEWWGREADLALLAGVYKHGFGNYEALQGDSQFTSAFRPLHRDNMKMLSEIDNGQHSSEFGDPNFKDRFHIDDDPEHMDMREGHKLYWPDANTLTRRLRRLVEHISRIEKEIDMSGKHIKEKPARIWTKREKMELVKVLMMWGRPLAMGDSSNYHWQLVRNQASIGLLKNRNQSSIENSIKGLEREMLQVLECSDTHQEKEHTSATEPSSPTIVGPKVLSNKNAVRLKERLELVDSLRQAMDSLPEDWGHLGLQLSQRNNMPSWWQAGHHDKELVKGVLAHGFGNWEAIFEDNNLNFRVSDSFSETGNHPDPKDCMKRLRFIGSHLRRRLRKLKARRKRHFFDDKENEISTEPRRFKRSRPNIPRTPDGRPILPLALTERLTIVDLGTIEYKRAGFHTDRHIFPIGYKSIRNYASMVEKDGRTTYTCTILDGGSAGPIFRVVPDDSPEKVIERDSASGAWAVVCGTGNKMRGIERGKITISGTEMFGLSHPTVIQLLRELPGAEYCSTFFSDYPTFGSHSRRQSISTPVIPSVQDGSEFRDTEVKQKPMSSFGDQSEQSLSDSSEETDSSDSSDEVDGSYQGVTSDKMAEDQSFTRRNMLVHSGNRERTYLDINADPEELESP